MEDQDNVNLENDVGMVDPLPGPISLGYQQKLYGPWVTSHVGLLQMIGRVQDSFAPPQTAGYDVSYTDNVPTVFTQREGYFHTSAVTYYVFDGNGSLSGYMEHVRGGHNQHQQIHFNGTYRVFRSEPVPGHFLYSGRMSVLLPIGRWNYYFVMKSGYELEWVWTPPPLASPPPDRDKQPRPLIARGTLTKVRNAGVLGRALQWLILG